MKKKFLILILLFCVTFSLSAENIYSFGASYIFFNEYSTFRDIPTTSTMDGIGLEFSYRYFSTGDYDTNFDINASDGSIVYTSRFNLKVGFWYSLNVNSPFHADIKKNNELFLKLNNKESNFWTLIIDNICGASFLMNLSSNFFIDISLGPKIGFFYINYENMTNLTFGIATELGGRYYFKNKQNSNVKLGLGFGSKITYDFYSIVQAYYPEDYSKYGIFSLTPFVSFMLKI